MEDGVTVIQEIANQLGMAVDVASNFIAEQLPAYAFLQVMNNSVPIILALILFLIFGGVCSVNYKKMLVLQGNIDKQKEIAKELRDACGSLHGQEFIDAHRACGEAQGIAETYEREEGISEVIVVVTAIIAAMFLIGFIMTVFNNLSTLIGWATVPNAMLIQEALNMIGK